MNDAETEIARLKARIAQLELENSRLTQRIQYLEKSVNAGSHGIGSSRPSSSGGGPSSTTSSRTSDVGSKLGTITFDQNNSDTSGGEQKYCDTCDRFVPLATFPMHTLHCARNTTECLHCGEKVSARQMDAHISSSVGTVENQIHAIVMGDLLRIEKMVQHGFVFTSALPSPTFSSEDATSRDQFLSMYYREGDTPLHVAARSRQLPVIEYFAASCPPISVSGVSPTNYFNMRNASGETPLHAACCSPDAATPSTDGTATPWTASPQLVPPAHPLLEVVACLVEKGADLHAKNLLGDTSATLVKRLGRTELLSFLSTLAVHLDGAEHALSSGGALPLSKPPSRPPSAPNSRPSSAHGLAPQADPPAAFSSSRPPSAPGSRPGSPNTGPLPPIFLPPVRPSSAAAYKERGSSAANVGKAPPLGGVPLLTPTVGGGISSGIASRRGSFLEPMQG